MTTLEKIRTELHATAEIHEDGDYYLRDKWVDEIIDKYAEQKPETVTEFADRCRECGARYGKLLKQQSCSDEDAMAKEYAKAFHFGMALGFAAKYDEMDKIIEEIKKAVKEKETCWTPVSEGLPKEGETVIASTKYGVYPEAKYTKEYGWEWAYESGADYWRELAEVEAWMPLPKRYVPQEETR